eukprot:766114-Hanusia_phi.AAC.4
MDQTLISTVRQTATAMKNLGLHKQIDDIDTVMADLEDSHLDMKEVTDLMSNRLGHADDIGDDELEAELSVLLGLDEAEGSMANLLLHDLPRPPGATEVVADEVPKLTSTMAHDEGAAATLTSSVVYTETETPTRALFT